MCEQSFLFSEGRCSFLSRDKENDVSATPKPQKTRKGEPPHVPPCGRALHRIRQSRIHKNAIAFLLNTRGSHIAKTLLSPPQRGRRKRRTTSGKRTQIPNKHISLVFCSGRRGRRPLQKLPFSLHRRADMESPPPEFAFPFTQMNYSDTQGNAFALQNKAPAAQRAAPYDRF